MLVDKGCMKVVELDKGHIRVYGGGFDLDRLGDEDVFFKNGCFLDAGMPCATICMDMHNAALQEIIDYNYGAFGSEYDGFLEFKVVEGVGFLLNGVFISCNDENHGFFNIVELTESNHVLVFRINLTGVYHTTSEHSIIKC